MGRGEGRARNVRRGGRTLLGLSLLSLLYACGGGGGGFPLPILNVVFPQPPVWDWMPGNGWLSGGSPTSGALDCALSANAVGGTTVVTPTYNGALVGPTLRIHPGDTFDLSVRNLFPPNPSGQRTGTTGAFPHDLYTTNLHTHGVTTDPGGISDNVLRTMEPSTVNPVRVCVPPYHPSGTMWYHPHKHGSVAWQLFGGMAGFLLIRGGPGTLDALPEVQAAQEYVMAFQAIRVDAQGLVPWVNTGAVRFAGASNGLWDPFIGTQVHMTTNGRVSPILTMRPGEVQRWRLLNATSGETLAVALDQHALHVVSLDGLTTAQVISLPVDGPLVLGAGNRADVMVQAGAPGVYVLRAVDPAAAAHSVSPQGVAAGPRPARVAGSIPPPPWPVSLVTVVVQGSPVAMSLPSGPLPVAADLATDCVLTTRPQAFRRVEFEICPNPAQPIATAYSQETCDEYRSRYDATFWGGTPFQNLLMLLDADDHGVWQKEALFDHARPLFSYPTDTPMVAGAVEEWTVFNRTPSDHPFHIHVNPFLLTQINGVPLPVPEWRDTVLVPARVEGPPGTFTDGSVTFLTHYDPHFPGEFVMHCHILTHEDVGMMQALEIVPGRGVDLCGPHAPACETRSTAVEHDPGR